MDTSLGMASGRAVLLFLGVESAERFLEGRNIFDRDQTEMIPLTKASKILHYLR
jgi:hypothetical protein